MNFGSLFRREWGAVTFVVTVVVGIIVVPVALAFNGPKVTPAAASSPSPAGSPAQSPAPATSAAPAPAPTPS
ncbi:MAG: hypothetical protein ACYDAY_09245 [Candidatus Dormibacteria bacterium]